MPLYDLRTGAGGQPELVELTAEEVEAIQAPLPVPDQVPMHKVEKAAIVTPWPGHENLEEAILWGMSQLPEPKNKLALVEWKRANNLVRLGKTTLDVMQLIGMNEQQRDDLILLADSMA